MGFGGVIPGYIMVGFGHLILVSLSAGFGATVIVMFILDFLVCLGVISFSIELFWLLAPALYSLLSYALSISCSATLVAFYFHSLPLLHRVGSRRILFISEREDVAGILGWEHSLNCNGRMSIGMGVVFHARVITNWHC